MRTVAIITAAGNSNRWGNHLNAVKQLAPIGSSGQTVIGRIVEMLRFSDVDDVFVATHDDKIIESVKNVKIIRPQNCKYLSETILSTHAQWADRTIILLGDVFFSEACFESILDCQDEVKFFGVDRASKAALKKIKRPELYAFSFDISAKEIIKRNLKLNSTLAGFRDNGGLTLPCLKKAAANNFDYLKTLYSISYPPKPPSILRKLGFRRNEFWRIYRSLVSKPRRTGLYGKLWGLYVCTASIDTFGGTDYKWPADKNDFLQQIDDFTQDVDSKEDYDKFIEQFAILNQAKQSKESFPA